MLNKLICEKCHLNFIDDCDIDKNKHKERLYRLLKEDKIPCHKSQFSRALSVNEEPPKTCMYLLEQMMDRELNA